MVHHIYIYTHTHTHINIQDSIWECRTLYSESECMVKSARNELGRHFHCGTFTHCTLDWRPLLALRLPRRHIERSLSCIYCIILPLLLQPPPIFTNNFFLYIQVYTCIWDTCSHNTLLFSFFFLLLASASIFQCKRVGRIREYSEWMCPTHILQWLCTLLPPALDFGATLDIEHDQTGTPNPFASDTCPTQSLIHLLTYYSQYAQLPSPHLSLSLSLSLSTFSTLYHHSPTNH